MTPNDLKGFIIAWEVIKDILLGSIGGFIAYIFNFERSKKDKNKIELTEKVEFSISSMLTYIFLGMFIGYLMGTVLEPKTYGRDVLISLGGFSAFSILVVADSRFAEWIYEKFNKKD